MSRPTKPASATARSRSLFRYSPALILVAIAIADADRLADPDLWWHLRVGQAVLAQGHPPWLNLHSYAVPANPFIDTQWLAEVLMALAYNALGVFGLKILKLLCTGSTILFLAVAMGETGAPTLVQFGVLTGSAVAMAWVMEFRPLLFTFALLSAMLAMLARENRGRRTALWLTIPMLAVWANLHGGFIMGLAALGVFSTVVCARDVVAGRGLARAFRLFGITAAAALATLITPYGVETWLAIVRALRNPYTRVVISEWQSLPTAILGQWHSRPGGVVYIAIAVILFAALAISLWLAPTADDLPLVAFAGVTIVSAYMAVRNLPIAVIATATPLTRHLGLAVADWRTKRGRPADPSPQRASPGNQLAMTAIAIVIAIESGFFSNRLESGDTCPVGAVRFMKEHHLHGKVLNNFIWNGYLIWHLEPASRIFIDGRYDFAYPVSFIGEYLRFHFALPGGAQVLEKYPPDYVLISPREGAFKLMESRSGWKLIYRDGRSALFTRADSPAAQLPGVPLIVNGKAPACYFP